MATATFDTYADEELWLLRSERESLRDEIADLKAQLADADFLARPDMPAPLELRREIQAELQTIENLRRDLADAHRRANDWNRKQAETQHELNKAQAEIERLKQQIEELSSNSEQLLECSDLRPDLQRLVADAIEHDMKFYSPGDYIDVAPGEYTVALDGPEFECEAAVTPRGGLEQGVRFPAKATAVIFEVG